MQHADLEVVSLKRAVVPIRIAHRGRIASVARWSLVRGRPVPMEDVALIIGAKRGEVDHWTRVGVHDFLSSDVLDWCSAERTLAPEHLPESLWTYLHFLAAHALLTPDSDPLARLLEPLRCYGGLGPDGRS